MEKTSLPFPLPSRCVSGTYSRTSRPPYRTRECAPVIAAAGGRLDVVPAGVPGSGSGAH